VLEKLNSKDTKIAIIGSSNNPEKFGNKILLNLLSKGHQVFPISKKEKEIANQKCFSEIKELNFVPDIINFVVPPNIGYGLTIELVNQGYDNFWYQPGAESKEISNFLTINKKNYIDDMCIMVEAKNLNN